jgi:hypothetical protein
MTKCLLKALKAVDLQNHVELFRLLGYDSAGALAHFHHEHFKQLNFSQQELLRFHALLDVLKEATREGKICPHYFNSTKPPKPQSTVKSAPIHASWSDETIQQRYFQPTIKKQTNDNLKSRRSMSSTGLTGRSSSVSMASAKTVKNHSNAFTLQRPSTVLSRQHHMTPTRTSNLHVSGAKSFLNRPPVQHVKVRELKYYTK